MRWIILFAALFVSSAASAFDIRVATFNTESDDDTQPARVAETIGQVTNVDIWALQEVEDYEAMKLYRDAARGVRPEQWRFVFSESGVNTDRQSDHLGILYRTDIFRQLETVEFHALRSRDDGSKYGRTDWRLRGALFLRLQHVPSKREFYVGTVHLKCCGEGADQRTHQTSLLAAWIKKQDAPVILLGDTNIPIEPGQTTEQVTAPAFRKLVEDGGLVWNAPSIPIKTQCDPEFNSMLDQVYHTSNLGPSAVNVEILFRTAAYCNRETQGYSDHRPVVATFSLP
ncbi:endonuclease/exonuclease/phosphatase family protein [Bradyrhizobium sp. USDA 336]|uniref:endonuclease/exonuclease/phosphatase family protein n=1 Tax=Bradyrhizobium sp. USDA 336 TaxID=3156311 RepID=UPI0038355874